AAARRVRPAACRTPARPARRGAPARPGRQALRPAAAHPVRRVARQPPAPHAPPARRPARRRRTGGLDPRRIPRDPRSRSSLPRGRGPGRSIHGGGCFPSTAHLRRRLAGAPSYAGTTRCVNSGPSSYSGVATARGAMSPAFPWFPLPALAACGPRPDGVRAHEVYRPRPGRRRGGGRNMSLAAGFIRRYASRRGRRRRGECQDSITLFHSGPAMNRSTAPFRIAAVIALVTLACDDSTGPEYPDPGPGPHFSVVPVPIETLARITPLGHMGIVMPNPHTYWHTCDYDPLLKSDRPCHLE